MLAPGVRDELTGDLDHIESPLRLRLAENTVRLPSPEEMKKLVFSLMHRLDRDPVAGREWLKKMFKDTRIELIPMPGRVYLAKGELLPLMLLAEKQHRDPGRTGIAVLGDGSGGRI